VSFQLKSAQNGLSCKSLGANIRAPLSFPETKDKSIKSSAGLPSKKSMSEAQMKWKKHFFLLIILKNPKYIFFSEKKNLEIVGRGPMEEQLCWVLYTHHSCEAFFQSDLLII
jgi:hypothetical protein